MNGDAIVGLIQIALGCGVPIVLLVFGFSIGTLRERKHFKLLAQREAAVSDMRITNLARSRVLGQPGPGADARMFTGEVVIGTDYFKNFIAAFVKITGGELTTYRSLMERGRREAILRMVEAARAEGYAEVRNVRIDKADVGGVSGGNSKNPMVMVAVIASGTGVKHAGV